MKKIICTLMSVLLMGSVSFAQSANKKVGTSPTQTVQPASKSTEAAPNGTAGPTTKTKKDGTPDMRHAENKKAATAPTQKLKKDGTPDMRYKENKATPAAKKAF